MAFDFSDVLKGMKTLDEQEQIVYLPYDALVPDPNNGYSMAAVEELARNIELVGLQQPPRVYPIADAPETYRILSGHRRHAAIGLILQRNPDAFPNGIPCIIDRIAGSAALQELKLILGNADNRVNTPADTLRNIEGVADCLRRLEAEGYHFEGRHRDWIAKMIGISKTKISRLQAIGKHLAPSLLEHFNAGELGVTAAYRLSQEKEQVQHDVYRTYGRGVNDLTDVQLEEAIARRKAPRQEPPVKVASNEKVGFDVDAYLENRRQEDESFFEMLNDVAKQFIEPLDEVNSRSAGIEKLKRRFGLARSGLCGPGNMVCYDANPKGLTLYRRGIPQIFRTWTEVYDMLCSIAINRSAYGERWDRDEEDEEDDEPMPTVRWESRAVTPPQRKPLLLYQLTNAGPKYTPAVYCGGAVFRKPAWSGNQGAELTGIAQQFTSWLKFPDPSSYGEEYRVAPPEPSTATLNWNEGNPGHSGWYAVKQQMSGIGWTFRRVLWFDGENWAQRPTSDKPIPVDETEKLVWFPLPDEEG